jgi:hypothetical protein
MPFVKRNEQGEVIAVSESKAPDYTEELSKDDPAVAAFIARVGSTSASSLDASDQDFVRVLEDVVELLITKGLILFTELPTNAQEKIMRRQKMRSQVGNLEDLIGDD